MVSSSVWPDGSLCVDSWLCVLCVVFVQLLWMACSMVLAWAGACERMMIEVISEKLR